MSPARSANQRAQAYGFVSAGALRRFGGVSALKKVRNLRDLERLPRAAQDARALGLRGLANMREGKDIGTAAAEAGTTPAVILAYAAPALDRRGGRIFAKPADRLYRLMKVYSGGRPVVVAVRGSRKATLVSRHGMAVDAFVNYESFEGRSGEEILAPFVGKRVGGVTLETDPRVAHGHGPPRAHRGWPVRGRGGMKLPPCLRCGRPGEERHHPEGKSASGRHFNPGRWISLCTRCHALIHKDLQPRGLDDDAKDLATRDTGELRCSRVMATFRRLVDGERGCLPAGVVLLIKACLWIYANWDPEQSWFQIVVLAAMMLRYLVTGSWE